MASVLKSQTAHKPALAGVHGDASEGPLYIRIARKLKNDIVDGVHPVGSLLPTEDELGTRFSVSRYTIREALRRLREDGLVASRQGAGTIVVPPMMSGSDIHHVMSINDLVAWASGARFVIDTMKMAPITEKLSARTGLALGEDWLEVRGLRHIEGSPSPECHTEYYINRAFAAVGRLLQRHNGPIFPLIEDMFGQSLVEVHQEISATLATPELAAALAVPLGSAMLEVRRSFIMADTQIAQVTINTHPASRFRHSMTMRRVRN
jgi:GntR family transcriptional regulator